ncbi:hypothetical protein [Pararhodobacter zhoushanensis]|uniref:hypothetical protein n=1 Tax=Pararhodobacter zhoushanensis TaxID=2479545 RepID=UPI000F8E38CA|nr:hypothetical protein [Pararhodobacter zhoushanensis]
MRPISFLISIAAYCALSGPALSQTDLRDQIRSAMQESMTLPDATQYATLGPLTDGRILEFEIAYTSGGRAPRVSRAFDNVFRIQFPRRSLGPVPFVSDAMLGCFLDTHSCDLIAAYVEQLIEIRSPSRMPFLDEVHPDHAWAVTSLRGSALYAETVLGGIASAISTVNLHEMCHAALGHLDDDATDLDMMTLEGQADGCMLEVFSIEEFAPVGGLPFIMDAVVREETLGEPSITHPSPTCRALALTAASIEWLAANRSLLRGLVPDFEMPSDQALRAAFGASSRTQDGECDAYEAAVAEGRALARDLYDSETELRSTP